MTYENSKFLILTDQPDLQGSECGVHDARAQKTITIDTTRNKVCCPSTVAGTKRG